MLTVILTAHPSIWTVVGCIMLGITWEFPSLYVETIINEMIQEYDTRNRRHRGAFLDRVFNSRTQAERRHDMVKSLFLLIRHCHTLFSHVKELNGFSVFINRNTC